MERSLTTKTNDLSPLNLQIDILLNRFSEIVDHTLTLIFPPVLKGITIPPDMANWSRLRRWAFMLSSPSISNIVTLKDSSDIVVFLAWLVAVTLWYNTARLGIASVLGFPPSITETKQPVWALIGAYLVLLMLFLLIFLAYWRWIEFFRDQRYRVIWRIILFLAFLMTMTVSIISAPNWLYSADEQIPSSSLLYIDPTKLRLFIIVLVLTIIPAGTFLFMLAIEALVLTVQLLRGYVRYIQSAHSPLFKQHIRELAVEPIMTTHSEKQKWRLIELSQIELEVIREWARANREGSDKRLLPTVILFASLGIVANTETFRNALDGLLTWISMYTTKNRGNQLYHK